MAHGARHYLENTKALALALTITTFFLIVEAAGGFFTNSLSLLADAGHMLSDVAALSLALFAAWMSSRPPTLRRTYGYYRMEVLATVVNAVTLVLIMTYIFWEAYRRIASVPTVDSVPMLAIAGTGLLANLASASILMRTGGESLNVRAALFHVLGDVGGSLAAILAALIMIFTGRFLADPILSIFIGVLIFFAAFSLMKEAIPILLEGVPGHLDTKQIEEAIGNVPGVVEVHDLHVWTITPGFVALSCHVVVNDQSSHNSCLQEIRLDLEKRFGVRHMTIQLEHEQMEEDFLHD